MCKRVELCQSAWNVTSYILLNKIQIYKIYNWISYIKCYVYDVIGKTVFLIL